MSNKKAASRKAKAVPQVSTSEDEERDVETQTTETQQGSGSGQGQESSTTVTDWTQESKLVSVGESTSPNSGPGTGDSRKSVLDFDHPTVQTFETRTVSSLSNDELFMVLIRRGEEQKNPVISGGCERLLRQINRERITPPPSQRSRSGPNTGTGGGAPGSHFRGRPQRQNERKTVSRVEHDDEYDQDEPQVRSFRGRTYGSGNEEQFGSRGDVDRSSVGRSAVPSFPSRGGGSRSDRGDRSDRNERSDRRGGNYSSSRPN